MSYCRWSSDDWKSDVYTYVHVDGSWTTHVAGRRRVGLETLPPNPYAMLRRGYSQLAFVVAYRLYNAALDNLPLVDIDLPYAGATFKDVRPQACAATLRMLRAAGYHVPDGVIEELEAEES